MINVIKVDKMDSVFTLNKCLDHPIRHLLVRSTRTEIEDIRFDELFEDRNPIGGHRRFELEFSMSSFKKSRVGAVQSFIKSVDRYAMFGGLDTSKDRVPTGCRNSRGAELAE
jgi:hypothetical protein